MKKLFLIALAIILLGCASQQNVSENSKWVTVFDEKQFPVAAFDLETKEIKFFADEKKVFQTLIEIILKKSEKPLEKTKK